MGQTAVDLPDPLESPTNASAAGADDLLSQLAGDEIDRLLAEAEVEREPVPAAPASKLQDIPATDIPPVGPAPAFTERATTKDVGDGSAVREEASDGEVASSKSRPNVNAQSLQSVDAVANAPAEPSVPSPVAKTETASTHPQPNALAPASESSGPAPAAAAPTAAPAESGAMVETATVDAVSESIHDESALLGNVLNAIAEADEESANVPLPVYLKPLEWINAPFAAAPDWARELMGKAAVVTIVNALAVIVYVLLFRRHR